MRRGRSPMTWSLCPRPSLAAFDSVQSFWSRRTSRICGPKDCQLLLLLQYAQAKRRRNGRKWKTKRVKRIERAIVFSYRTWTSWPRWLSLASVFKRITSYQVIHNDGQHFLIKWERVWLGQYWPTGANTRVTIYIYLYIYIKTTRLLACESTVNITDQQAGYATKN